MTTGTRTQAVAPVVVIVGVMLATAFVIFAPDPDVRTGVSEDGRMEIQGPVGADTVMSLVQEDDEQSHTVLLMPAYTISVNGQAPSSAFSIRVRDGNADAIFAYDTSVLAWRPLTLEHSTISGVLDTRSYAGAATYAAGKRPVLTPPANRHERVAAILAGAPPGTIGFDVSDAIAWAPEEFIVVSDRFAQGGCGGRFDTSTSTRLSTQEYAQKDGTTYRMLVRWYLGNGCAPGAPLAVSP